MVKSNSGATIGAGERVVLGGNLNNKGDIERGRGRWGCWATVEAAWIGCASDTPDDGRRISQSMGNIEVAAMNKHLPSTGAW